MSVSSYAKYEFTSNEQIEALKDYKYDLTGKGQEDKSVYEIMAIDASNYTMEFSDCFCRDDFEWIIPDLSTFIAERVREKSFVCHDAYFTNDVDGSTIEFDIEYNKGTLKIGTRESGESDEAECAEDCCDLSFVITGKLNKFDNRDNITDYIEAMGGYVKESVSKNTDFLICNDVNSNSKKIKKAREFDIPILSELEFISKFCNPYDFCEDESIKAPYDYRVITIDEIQNDSTSQSQSEKKWSTKTAYDGSLVITGYKGNDKSIVIPEYIGKSKVTSIEERAFSPWAKDHRIKSSERAHYYRTVLKQVTIPKSVSNIEQSAFHGCKGLKEVVIKGSVERIKEEVFSDCEKLAQISIAEGLERIDESAFSGCISLTSFDFPSTLKTIGSHAFKDCGFEKVTIPETVTEIEEGAFENCKSLSEASLPEGIEKIENRVFAGCRSLTSFGFPSTLHTIGYEAFYGCGFESLIIPATITEIEERAFENCWMLNTVNIPESLRIISAYAFERCSSLKSVIVPEGVEEIKEYAFDLCGNLEDICLPNTVNVIESCAFKFCTSLKRIELPNKLKKISAGLFYECKSLPEITIPNGVTEIEEYAFEECENLTKIELPESLKKIGVGAFAYCISLKNIAVPEGLEEISRSSIAGCEGLVNKSIQVPDSVRIVE